MKILRSKILLGLAAAGAAGCATVTTADGERLALGSNAFRDYVESVFRQQNRTATRLAFALEADGLESAAYDALAAAEDALLAACSDLNALAASRRDGQDLGTSAQLAAARQAPRCERAARRAQSLMVRLDVPEV